MNLSQLHHYWFGKVVITPRYYETHVPRWFFGQDESFDRGCQAFTDLLTRDDLGEQTPQERVAQILLFDQIPRNSFRQTARAFTFDQRARDLSSRALQDGLEKDLTLPERLFLYMPFEHAEDLAFQELSVAKFEELHLAAPTSIRDWTQLALDKAHSHHITIQRFGRFPQRNLALGRTSTPPELEYLSTL